MEGITLKYVVKRNRSRHVVFEVDSEKKGFGSWKIKKNFPTKKKADDYAEKMNEEEKEKRKR